MLFKATVMTFNKETYIKLPGYVLASPTLKSRDAMPQIVIRKRAWIKIESAEGCQNMRRCQPGGCLSGRRVMRANPGHNALPG